MNHQYPTYDLLVIGGGINGAGIAADASGRGLKVMLCEMNDLASATSSSSSKLIHGGLRYLEHYEFRLVKEALAEREVLLKKAPHIIWPLRFLLPHQPHLRPAWMIKAGLFLYDHLATRTTLGASESVDFGTDSPLNSEMRHGFEYSDGWVDDARLVVLNAVAAHDAGACIKTRTRCIKAKRRADHWVVTLQNTLNLERYTVAVKALVNATGPWVSELLTNDVIQLPPSTDSASKKIRLVKGSHIIVPRIHDAPEAFILQNKDERIIFVIPFEDKYSLIGTTDVEYEGDPSKVSISKAEIDYLITVTNEYFKTPISANDITWSYSGVRPLLDDDESDSAQAVSRDYSFEIDTTGGGAPLLCVFGGKITTYRKLAEAAVNTLSDFFNAVGPAWTENAHLPGGGFEDHTSLSNEMQRQYTWLPDELRNRYVRTYGTLAYTFLSNTTSLENLGECFGANLYAAEVDYLIKYEWALSTEDILWRRTKLGLSLSEIEVNRLGEYLKVRHSHKES
ncbi:glycerol-3-phosphate dehydrogenase [Neptunomonas japonica]|uniref:Glycerol-3-phosphate dehydrogenase n=1 Tax=Neptunomonas japonica JAMM 1380 TaxID=1441457 RepID=A0A7R6PD63_9GAMM|nr:glycerol-3-phosphate dehydrogenase [Neptunomonas japonica]BBB30324.1 glycerol-3-phosphate dehydrogenase [Neptunomonas japonica JAMM 1380]